MRVLILTATVGEGHNAAARAVSESIRARDPSVEVIIENSLRRVSPLLEKFIVSSYRFQLRRAPWSYRLLYDGIIKSGGLTKFTKWLCGIVGGSRSLKLIKQKDPDVVLSTYPLTSAMLERLRVRHKTEVPCANILTDFAPHPMWMYSGLDANYVMHDVTGEAVEAMMGKVPTQVVSPPVSPRFHGPPRRAEGRRFLGELGVPEEGFVTLVVGGGWGVGNLAETAAVTSSVDEVWTVVICGRNEQLREELSKQSLPRTVALGFVDNMPDLLDAADLVVHNAGGLTSLEAMVRGAPLFITDPIPGHGVANAKLMARVGAARSIGPGELAAAVKEAVGDGDMKSRAAAVASEYSALPDVAGCLLSLGAARAAARQAEQ